MTAGTALAANPMPTVVHYNQAIRTRCFNAGELTTGYISYGQAQPKMLHDCLACKLTSPHHWRNHSWLQLALWTLLHPPALI